MNFDMFEEYKKSLKENVELKKEPKGNLEDYLELLDDEALSNLAHYWDDDFELKDYSKEESITILKENILDNFVENICTLSAANLVELRDFASGKINKITRDNIYQVGALYVYKGKTYMPDDIKDLCGKYINDEVIFNSEFAYFCITTKALIFLYGIISVDDVIKIYTKDKKIYNKEEITNEIDEVYSVVDINGVRYLLNDSIKLNDEYKNIATKKINKEFSATTAFMYSFDIINGIKRIQENNNIKNEHFIDDYIAYVFPKYQNAQTIANYFKEKYKLSNKKTEKLVEEIKYLEDDILYWDYRGYYKNDIDAKKFVLTKLPKDEKLKSYLEVLNKDALGILYDKYDTDNISTLVPLILDEFSEYTYDYDVFIEDDEIDNNELTKGFYFEYKNKKMIPDEIKVEYNMSEVIKNQLYRNYIPEYVLINGVIERKALQKILKEHHGMDYSLKEIDEIILDCGLTISGDYYYYLSDISDFEKDLILKARNNDYKILDESSPNYLDFITGFAKKLKMICQKHNFGGDVLNEMTGSILFLLHLNMFSRDFFNSLAQSNNSFLKEDLIDDIVALANEYKNDFPLWNKNGYSMNELMSKPKVGRNDPCICGSGKKYKKCCGK